MFLNLNTTTFQLISPREIYGKIPINLETYIGSIPIKKQVKSLKIIAIRLVKIALIKSRRKLFLSKIFFIKYVWKARPSIYINNFIFISLQFLLLAVVSATAGGARTEESTTAFPVTSDSTSKGLLLLSPIRWKWLKSPLLRIEKKRKLSLKSFGKASSWTTSFKCSFPREDCFPRAVHEREKVTGGDDHTAYRDVRVLVCHGYHLSVSHFPEEVKKKYSPDVGRESGSLVRRRHI